MTTNRELEEISNKLFNKGKNDIQNILNQTSLGNNVDYNNIASNIYNWYHDKQESKHKIYKSRIISYISKLIKEFENNINKTKYNHHLDVHTELNTYDLIDTFNEWNLYQKQDISMEIIDDDENNQMKSYLEYRDNIIKTYNYLSNIISEYETFVQQYYIQNYQSKQLELFPINSLKNLIFMLTENHNQIIYKILMFSYFSYIDFNLNNISPLKPIIGYNNINEPTLIYILNLNENLTTENINEIISQYQKYMIPKIMIIKFDTINKPSLINYFESFIFHNENNINFTILDKNDIYELLYLHEINLSI